MEGNRWNNSGKLLVIVEAGCGIQNISLPTLVDVYNVHPEGMHFFF